MTTLNSFTDRRKVREEIERSGAQGETVDNAIPCRCPDCGQTHYRPKEQGDKREEVVSV